MVKNDGDDQLFNPDDISYWEDKSPVVFLQNAVSELFSEPANILLIVEQMKLQNDANLDDDLESIMSSALGMQHILKTALAYVIHVQQSNPPQV